MDGFLGTGASFRSDVTLIAYILFIMPAMIVGFVFARRKMFEPYHKYTMISIVLLNWVLITVVMFASFQFGVAPQVPAGLGQTRIWLPFTHFIIGVLAQLLGSYLVIRMVFENQLPGWLKVRNIKHYMRITLTGWFLAAFMGIGTYAIWYVVPSQADEPIPAPVATDEANPEPAATDEAIPDPDATDEANPEPAATDEAIPDPDATDEANPEPAATDEAIPDPDATDEPSS